jgi:hypothetical protein
LGYKWVARSKYFWQKSQIATLQIKGPVRIQYKCLVPIYVFPEMKPSGLAISRKQNYNVPSPNFHIHVSVNDLYIPRIGLFHFAAAKYADRSCEYINRPKMDFRYSACLKITKKGPTKKDYIFPDFSL